MLHGWRNSFALNRVLTRKKRIEPMETANYSENRRPNIKHFRIESLATQGTELVALKGIPGHPDFVEDAQRILDQASQIGVS